MNYSQRIKALREDHDLSQQNAADILHVSQTTYSDYENEKIRIPLDNLIKLAKFYDVDMDYIAGLSNHSFGFPKSCNDSVKPEKLPLRLS